MLDNVKEKVVVALGMFDSVHVGHKKVIESAVLQAKNLNCKCVVITFNKDIKSTLSLNFEGGVFPMQERFDRIKRLGVDMVYALTPSKKVLMLSPNEFLSKINAKFSIEEYFCGEDYTFGLKASGNAKTLSEYANKNFQKLTVIPIVEKNGEKISSSKIKSLLKEGNVSCVNEMLTEDYSINGLVVEGRKVGRKLGFPTVNIKPDLEGNLLKNGVYSGYTFINGKRKNCVINYGQIPSFLIDKVGLEAHILDVNENLYGKNLTIYFTKYIRDIKKFSTIEDLKKQLEKDIQTVQND